MNFFQPSMSLTCPQQLTGSLLLSKVCIHGSLQKFHIFPAINGRKEVEEKIWKKFTRNWRRLDLTTEKGAQAFDSQRQGEAGCYLSHYTVIKQVKEKFDEAIVELEKAYKKHDPKAMDKWWGKARKYSSVLIIEDDNGFGIVSQDKLSVRHEQVGVLFRQAMLNLPQDWEMLYFMTFAKSPSQEVAPNIIQLSRGICLNAYAINYRIYDALVECLKKIEDPNVQKVLPVDDELAMLHSTHQCYAINPSIAYQREGESSITSKVTNKYRQTQPVYKAPEEKQK